MGGGGHVQYVDKLPFLDFANDSFEGRHIKQFFYKERQWEVEQEYRLHKMWPYPMDSEKRTIKLNPEAIVEIRLGKAMPTKTRKVIMDIAVSKYPNANLIE